MGRPTLELNTHLGPYFLERLIAVGGMAEIYLVRARGLAGFERQLVLKVIQPDYAGNERFVQMLVDEAKIAVGLNHPNIAQTFDLGKTDGCFFISMEYVDGADFFQILARLSEMDAHLPIEAALHVVDLTLCALDYAHTKNGDDGQPLQIIHRDVSPQNILLSRYGEVKLVDFGVAKAANLSHTTIAGVIKGKLAYMSPEQARGETVDQRTDIFSAGVVLYEALTMGSLYQESNQAKLLEQVRRAAIERPSARRPGIPTELDELVMKALSPRPADRYQTAREFADVLRRYRQRLAPDFGEQQIGAIVEAVLAGRVPGPADRSATSPSRDVMSREDFAVQEHSMIFSADEQRDAERRAARARALAAPTVQPTPAPVANRPPKGVVGSLQLLGSEQTKPCRLGAQFTIGRAGDLQLGDTRVSRRHARIHREENAGEVQYLLEDLGSSNGTYLNGAKISQPCALQHGDTIRVGPFEMRFALEQLTAAPEGLGRRKSASSGLAAASSAASEQALPVQPSLSEERALVSLTVGAESLTLAIGERLVLAHTFGAGPLAVEGETAVLVRHAEGYWLEPISGREPLLHNGRKITAPVQLSPGDSLQLGPLQLMFGDGSKA